MSKPFDVDFGPVEDVDPAVERKAMRVAEQYALRQDEPAVVLRDLLQALGLIPTPEADANREYRGSHNFRRRSRKEMQP